MAGTMAGWYDNRIRLPHGLEAADTVAPFIAGRDRAALDQDRGLVFALVRAVEILGAAAAKVSAETRRTAPDAPWGRIVAMRARLIHAYFEIGRNILWKTMLEEVPVLAAQPARLTASP